MTEIEGKNTSHLVFCGLGIYNISSSLSSSSCFTSSYSIPSTLDLWTGEVAPATLHLQPTLYLDLCFPFGRFIDFFCCLSYSWSQFCIFCFSNTFCLLILSLRRQLAIYPRLVWFFDIPSQAFKLALHCSSFYLRLGKSQRFLHSRYIFFYLHFLPVHPESPLYQHPHTTAFPVRPDWHHLPSTANTRDLNHLANRLGEKIALRHTKPKHRIWYQSRHSPSQQLCLLQTLQEPFLCLSVCRSRHFYSPPLFGLICFASCGKFCQLHGT